MRSVRSITVVLALGLSLLAACRGTPSGQDCEPTACRAEICGTIADGCGGTIDCGTCPAGLTCGARAPNVCGPSETACKPVTCSNHPRTCGVISDGCDGVLDCGGCPGSDKCVATAGKNVCVSCTPVSCSAHPRCGVKPDRCGGMLDCGPCAPPEDIGCEVQAPTPLPQACVGLTPASCGLARTYRHNEHGTCHVAVTETGATAVFGYVQAPSIPRSATIVSFDGSPPIVVPLEGRGTVLRMIGIGAYFHVQTNWGGSDRLMVWNDRGEVLKVRDGDVISSRAISEVSGLALWVTQYIDGPFNPQQFSILDPSGLSIFEQPASQFDDPCLDANGRLLVVSWDWNLGQGRWCGPHPADGCGPQFPLSGHVIACQALAEGGIALALYSGRERRDVWSAYVPSGENRLAAAPPWLAAMKVREFQHVGAPARGYAFVDSSGISLRGLDGTDCGRIAIDATDGTVTLGPDGTVVASKDADPCTITQWRRMLADPADGRTRQ